MRGPVEACLPECHVGQRKGRGECALPSPGQCREGSVLSGTGIRTRIVREVPSIQVFPRDRSSEHPPWEVLSGERNRVSRLWSH